MSLSHQNDLDMIVPAGTLLVIEHGAYSDKVTNHPVLVLKSFRKRDVAEAFRMARKMDDDHSQLSSWDFLPWLVKAGYVEANGNVHTWHVGDYEFEPEGE